MGVIDSLSAGYRFVTERLYLLAIPILLDILLWRLPRLSIVSLLERLAALYQETVAVEGMPTDLVQMTEQLSTLLAEIGRQTNLFNLMVNNALLHVPSILVLTGPLSATAATDVTDSSTVISLALLLSLIGVLIGTIYLGSLAEYLPIGMGKKHNSWPAFLVSSGKRSVRVVLFALLVVLGFLALMIPVSIGVTVLALVSPGLASGISVLVSGIAFVIFFNLYFVTVGLVMDDLPIFQAISRSLRIMRNYFWSALGFILLINLISLGLSMIFIPLAAYVPIGTIAAILLNAYIGSGLAMSLLVFYRTRALILDENVKLDELLKQL